MQRSLLCCMCGLLVLAASAQEQKPFTIHDNVDLVLLDASVRKVKGSYAAGLTKENFAVFDDGRERSITHFSAVDAPVTIGLIVDNSGSMRPKRPEVVMAGLAFAKSSNPQDEFFVINFNDRVYSAMPSSMPFSDQLQTLRSALFMGTPSGRTALYDAIAAGLEHLSEGHRELKTLIVVSDGGDNASRIRLPDLLHLVTASRATVYTVGLLDPEDRDLNPGVLRKLSAISGGEFYAPKNLDEVLPVFRRISNDIRHRYTIGFVPPQKGDSHRVHNLRVLVRDGLGTKYSVHVRTSYVTSSAAKL